jgi:photosystem II stability/assembly factor-like uncharacterized protein
MDPLEDIDAWLQAGIDPLPPRPGTLEVVRKAARQRKLARAAVAAASLGVVVAAVAVPFRLIPHQPSQVAGVAAPSATVAGNGPAPGRGQSSAAKAIPSPAETPNSATTVPAPAATLGAGVSGFNPVPADFDPSSVTFIGPQTGAVLGQAGTPGQCAEVPTDCTSIAGTSDYGVSWYGIRAPVAPGPNGSLGISQIRFLNFRDGWAFGPQLYATHDGGATWREINTNGLRVTSLESAGSRVFALWTRCTGSGSQFAADCSSFSLYSSQADSDNWHPATGATNLQASSLSTAATLVLMGNSGYLLTPSGTVLSGQAGGPWNQIATAPCLPGPAKGDGQASLALLGSGSTSLYLVCSNGTPESWQHKTLYWLSPKTLQWQSLGTVQVPGEATSLASYNVDILVLGATSGIYYSLDGGTDWIEARLIGRVPSEGFAFVGMTNQDEGVAVPAKPSLHEIWTTRDGGRTWTASQI